MDRGLKYCLIINGKAAKSKRRKVEAYLSKLASLGVSFDKHITSYEGHASRLARDAWDAGMRSFIAMGGDGTSFEILNGVVDQAIRNHEKPRLAILPLGTGNSFLRDFASENDGARTLQALAEERTLPCDVVEATHDGGAFYFMNLLSLGFVADVAFFRNRWLKRLGVMGYAASVCMNVVSLRSRVFAYRTEAGMFEGPLTFLSFNNSQYTGGQMKMAPGASLQDGLVDVVAVAPLGRCDLLRTFPKIFSGQHLRHPKVSLAQVPSVTFLNLGEEPVMVDGETMKVRLRALRVRPSAIEVVL